MSRTGRMVDASLVGRTFPPYSATVEAGRLRRFAKAIGETRPECVDEEAARAAGHPGLLAPPTFAVCLSLDVPDPFDWLRELGVDLARMLHAAQGFRYFAPVHAGDRLSDIAYAREAGLPDVFAHGMLSMAWLGRLLTGWTSQHTIREFNVRFTAITRVGERIVCSGHVAEKLERDGERLVRVVVVRTASAAGEVKLAGDALIALR